MRLLSAFVVGALLTACADGARDVAWNGTVDTLADGRIIVTNPATALWDSASAWTIEEELRIGSMEGAGPDLFASIAGLEVDALGRLWVLDRTAKELRVFAPDGSHVRTIGREGGGPGEFRDPIGLALHPDGRVWVVDPSNARYAVFDSSGAYLTAHQRQLTGYSVPWRGGFDAHGRLLEAASARVGTDYRTALLRHDSATVPVDTILVPTYEEDVYELSGPQGVEMTANVPFTPTLVWTFDPDGGMWSGVNGEYRMHQQDAAGDTVRVVSRAYEHLPVTAEERAEAVERMAWFTRQGGRVDASRIPARKPAFSRIDVAPDGHVWVTLTRPRGEAATLFDIFDPTGRYLGQIRSPASFYPRILFRGAHIYGVTADSLGVFYVVRARVVGQPPS